MPNSRVERERRNTQLSRCGWEEQCLGQLEGDAVTCGQKIDKYERLRDMWVLKNAQGRGTGPATMSL